MKVDSTITSGAILTKATSGAEDISRIRKNATNSVDSEAAQKKVQPEEILDQIKALTDNGVYSVRFEREDKTNQLVMRLVDVESGETIRQLPPEEIIDLAQVLKDLRGSLVDTTG